VLDGPGQAVPDLLGRTRCMSRNTAPARPTAARRALEERELWQATNVRGLMRYVDGWAAVRSGEMETVTTRTSSIVDEVALRVVVVSSPMILMDSCSLRPFRCRRDRKNGAERSSLLGREEAS